MVSRYRCIRGPNGSIVRPGCRLAMGRSGRPINAEPFRTLRPIFFARSEGWVVLGVPGWGGWVEPRGAPSRLFFPARRGRYFAKVFARGKVHTLLHVRLP